MRPQDEVLALDALIRWVEYGGEIDRADPERIHLVVNLLWPASTARYRLMSDFDRMRRFSRIRRELDLDYVRMLALTRRNSIVRKLRREKRAA